ncbi:hypothetical protein KKH36_02975 [Patescibacteria group bacterium]|nr:hypothetical protein [Patescibacteria group bacterium]
MLIGDTEVFCRKIHKEEKMVTCENCKTKFKALFADGIFRGIEAYNKKERCCCGGHQMCSEKCKKEFQGDVKRIPIAEALGIDMVVDF